VKSPSSDETTGRQRRGGRPIGTPVTVAAGIRGEVPAEQVSDELERLVLLREVPVASAALDLVVSVILPLDTR